MKTEYETFKKDSQWKLTRSYIIGGVIIFVFVGVTTGLVIYIKQKNKENLDLRKDLKLMRKNYNNVCTRLQLVDNSLKNIPIANDQGMPRVMPIKQTHPKIFAIPPGGIALGNSFVGATVDEDSTVYGFFREKLENKGMNQKGLISYRIPYTLEEPELVK